MRRLLANGPLDRRLRAAWALFKAGDSGGDELLVWAARNAPSKDDQSYAVTRLGRIQGDACLEFLVALFEHSDDAKLREASALALSDLGEPAVPALRNFLLNHPDRWARVKAADSLGLIGGKAAAEALLSCVDDLDETVAVEALGNLTRTRYEGLDGLLLGLLEGKAKRKELVINYFLRHRNSRAVPALLRAWEEAPDRWHRDNLVEALRFQTGADFGADLEAWRGWFEKPGRALELGDPAAFLQPDTSLEALIQVPRLVAWIRCEDVDELTVRDGRLIALQTRGDWLEFDLKLRRPSPDGSLLAVSDRLGLVTLYELPGLEPRATIRQRRKARWPDWRALRFSEDGRYLLARRDSEVAVWDLKTSNLPTGDRDLLVELWTGMKLQDGMPVPLTTEEHRQRIERWRQKGFGEWLEL